MVKLTHSYVCDYVQVEGFYQRMHALRRGLYTGYAWLFIHLPLHLSIVGVGVCNALLICNSVDDHSSDASSSMNVTSTSAPSTSGHVCFTPSSVEYPFVYRAIYCIALSVTMLSLTLIGLLHQGKHEVCV